MKEFFLNLKSAIEFITIIPIGKKGHQSYSPISMIRYFPLTGLIIGVLLFCFDFIVSKIWMPSIASILDVVFMVIITGAFHLDGLGDTADGLFCHQNKKRCLEIMKDSRTGIMGVIAIFCVLTIKVAGVFAVKTSLIYSQTILLFVIVPSYSRAGMLFGIKFLNYGRKENGKGFEFFKTPLNLMDFVFLLVPVFLSFFLGTKALLLNLLFFITIFAVLSFYKKKLNCITGDMLGAMNEITEAVLLLTAAIHF